MNVPHGHTDPTVLAQVEAYEDAAAEMTELLASVKRRASARAACAW
jgi:hypothetical protein